MGILKDWNGLMKWDSYRLICITYINYLCDVDLPKGERTVRQPLVLSPK